MATADPPLNQQLAELQAWLRKNGHAPGWSKVLLAEARQVASPTEPSDQRGKLSRAYLRTLAEFEPRWNELVSACRGSWITFRLKAYWGIRSWFSLKSRIVGMVPLRPSLSL